MIKKVGLAGIFWIIASASVSAQAVIDISQSAPPGFPADGSALLLGDHVQVPHFFWRDQEHLSVFRLDSVGTFEAVSLPDLPTSVSELKTAPRSTWANAVFFWSQEGTTQSLWAIRDRGQGFTLTALWTRTISAAAALPRFWVEPIGRLGWSIFFEADGGIRQVFWSYTGKIEDRGVVLSLQGTVVDLAVFERPDFDSGVADVVIQQQVGSEQVFEILTFTNLLPGQRQTMATLPGGSKTTSTMAYTPAGTARTIFLAAGTRLWGIPLDGQMGVPWSRDFGVPVTVQLLSAPSVPGALVVRELSGLRFWWAPIVPEVRSATAFAEGVLPFADALVPLVTDNQGAWTYLAYDTVNNQVEGVTRLANGEESSTVLTALTEPDVSWADGHLRIAAVIRWGAVDPPQSGDGWILTPEKPGTSSEGWRNLPRSLPNLESLRAAVLFPATLWVWSGLELSTNDSGLKMRPAWGLGTTAVVLTGGIQ